MLTPEKQHFPDSNHPFPQSFHMALNILPCLLSHSKWRESDGSQNKKANLILFCFLIKNKYTYTLIRYVSLCSILYVYTPCLYRVCVSYFPRRSLSKPQTDTPCSSLDTPLKHRQITNVNTLHHSCFFWQFPRFFTWCAKSASVSQDPAPHHNGKCQSDRAGTDLLREDCRSREMGSAAWPTPLQLLCCPLTSTTHVLSSTADTLVLSKRAASAWWHCWSKPVHLSW